MDRNWRGPGVSGFLVNTIDIIQDFVLRGAALLPIFKTSAKN